ncbi:MAG: hypothetical protein H0U63_00295 [Burkholderiales bacterium]|nr:hypothetical protein [Burkholderiales bacterium]
MGQAAKQAADNINDFRAAQLTSGGTGAQTAQLRSIGGVTGVDMNQMAREFSRTISTDGIAAGIAGRAGIYDPGGELFGDNNKAKNLLEWADKLAEMSQSERTRAARLTKMEPLLKYADMSQKVRDQMKNDSLQSESIMTPEAVRNAANFNGQLIRLNTAFSDLATILGKEILPVLTTGIEAVTWAVRGFNDALQKPPLSWLAKMVIGGAVGGAQAGAQMAGGKPAGVKDPQVAASEANTDALRQLSQLLKNGMYGGGERARGAVPGAWKGMNQGEWQGQAMNLGAFTL